MVMLYVYLDSRLGYYLRYFSPDGVYAMNEQQYPNDAAVAGKVAMVAAAATAAANMTKPQRERESVVGAAFWISVIFFWFRAIYMYFKYVTQWGEVQELGAKGRLWKAVWPLVAAASPLFVIKFMAVGAALHNKSWPMIGIYISLALMLTLFLPFFLDGKYFYAERMPQLTDSVGRFFYSLAFVVSILLLGSIDSTNRYVMWFWSGDLWVAEKGAAPSNPSAPRPATVASGNKSQAPLTAAPEAVPAKKEPRYVPDQELWDKVLSKIPRKSSDDYETDVIGERQRLNSQWGKIKARLGSEEFKVLSVQQEAWSSFTFQLSGDWKAQLAAYQIRNDELRQVLLKLNDAN